MATNKHKVIINSDGSVMTYDQLDILMIEFTGALPILHKILRYVNSTDKKVLVADLRLYDPTYVFRVSGSSREFIIPKEHVVKFTNSIIPYKEGNIDFVALALKLGISEEELNNC